MCGQILNYKLLRIRVWVCKGTACHVWKYAAGQEPFIQVLAECSSHRHTLELGNTIYGTIVDINTPLMDI